MAAKSSVENVSGAVSRAVALPMSKFNWMNITGTKLIFS